MGDANHLKHFRREIQNVNAKTRNNKNYSTMRDLCCKHIIMERILVFLFILIISFSCTQLTPEEKMIKETLGKTVEIGMFESVRQGDRVIPFGEFSLPIHITGLP